MKQILQLPDKIYFKIGEVSSLLALRTHVLRYWETEFPGIKPVKSKTGQRLYRRSDIETLGLVKDLLYRQKFTIEGARRHLKSLGVGKSLEEKEKRDRGDLKLNLEQVRERVRGLVHLVELLEKQTNSY